MTPLKLKCFVPSHITKFTSFSFLEEQSLNNNIYPGTSIKWLMTQLLQILLISQLHDDSADFIFQKGDVPPHFHLECKNI
jgi:hypothetical protein